MNNINSKFKTIKIEERLGQYEIVELLISENKEPMLEAIVTECDTFFGDNRENCIFRFFPIDAVGKEDMYKYDDTYPKGVLLHLLRQIEYVPNVQNITSIENMVIQVLTKTLPTKSIIVIALKDDVTYEDIFITNKVVSMLSSSLKTSLRFDRNKIQIIDVDWRSDG